VELVMSIALGALERMETSDAAAFLDALFREHHARLYRLARRMSRDPHEALDLVQEAFLRAARSPESVPRGAGALPWLVRTVVNLCHDRWRRLEVRGRHAQGVLRDGEPAADPESAAVARAAVEAALAHLPPRQRAVLVLHELEGLEVAEVARQLGVSRVTVRWHLSGARRALRRWLEAEAGKESL
jgi:RNA polymerase sigma-70 factor, ECF subfamily